MTSEREECFVYVQLPGELRTVTCGRFVLERGVGRFVYRRSYLADPAAVELDGFELPLQPGTFETARLRGLFGALRDASPDAWGRRVIERFHAAGPIGEVTYLLESPEDRAGALSFGRSVEPPATVQRFNQVLQLRQLLDAAEAIDRDAPLPPQLEQLLQPGTSLGGARPKNVVEHEGALWVAKFPSRGDRFTYAAVEAAMLLLARECGLNAAEGRVTAVGEQAVLLVRRFDRERQQGGYVRHRMVSALTVLRADEEVVDRARWSYLELADELARWSDRPAEDLRELFGRIAFNALISNTDDHPRNHALLAAGRGWRLSPAYDLVPGGQRSEERRDLALVVGSMGRWANRANLLSAAPRFRLAPEEAAAIIDRVRDVVRARWRELARRAGASAQDCEVIAGAFVYAGFDRSGD